MQSNSRQGYQVPLELLDDVGSRFLLDADTSVLEDPLKLSFLTEQAYWFYLDEYVDEDDNLNSLKFDAFTIQLFKRMNISPPDGKSIDEMIYDFRSFKSGVPTYGGLLLNDELTHVLLVQGFRIRESWSWPKGKINEGEEPHACAIREVLEETGFDISHLINPLEYLENSVGEQKIRLYIIRGVPVDTNFKPQTKGEIKDYKWFSIPQLPSHKNDRSVGGSSYTKMFYMVMPFVKPLRDWISAQQRNRTTPLTSKNHKSRSSTPGNVPKKQEQVPQEKNRQKFTFKNQDRVKKTKDPIAAFMQNSKVKPYSAPSWLNFTFDTKMIFRDIDEIWQRASKNQLGDVFNFSKHRN